MYTLSVRVLYWEIVARGGLRRGVITRGMGLISSWTVYNIG